MTDAEAKALLDYLGGQPGQLKIITAEPDQKAKTQDPRDPAYFVLHDATSFDVHPVRKHLMAHSAEGDYVEVYGGGAYDLLVRLTEWQHFDSDRPDVANLARDKAAAVLEANYALLKGLGKV